MIVEIRPATGGPNEWSWTGFDWSYRTLYGNRILSASQNNFGEVQYAQVWIHADPDPFLAFPFQTMCTRIYTCIINDNNIKGVCLNFIVYVIHSIFCLGG